MKDYKKQCVKCNTDFIVDSDEQGFYEKMKVPTPNVCPDCRFMMRLLWRNETSLYTGRKCDMCQKSIVTMYNPKSLYVVYCYECYRGDKWDPKDYAMDYDLNRPFFDQLKDLFIKTPKAQAYRTSGLGQNINSDYVNGAGGVKNCYFIFNTGLSEECMYDRGLKDCMDVVDSYFGTKMDQCYEVINGKQSSQTTYSKSVVGCVDSHFLLNCSGLTNCFGCVNLRNKANCFFNEQLTPEEYKNKIDEILGSYEKIQEIKNRFDQFVLDFPYRANNNIKTINSVGDYLSECKNVKDGFEITKAEDCRYIFSSKLIKDSCGTIGFGYYSELLLECVAVGVSSNVIGSYAIDEGQNIQYSISCFPNNKDLFGCDSLQNSQYCILNKQYDKEEYEKIKEHIVKELTEKNLYGLMMPPELAPFAYNETIGQDNMPMTKEEVLSAGFRWEDDIQMTKGKESLEPAQIPDHIKDVNDNITKEILRCVDCERNYKITEQELLFYRKMTIPIPRKCFYCRHKDRVFRRGPFKFFIRKCSHCGIDTHTNLTEKSAPIMYCEKCYQQEVI